MTTKNYVEVNSLRKQETPPQYLILYFSTMILTGRLFVIYIKLVLTIVIFFSGYYLFFDASSPINPTQKAEIMTPEFNSAGVCVRLRYSVNGDAAGELKISTRDSSGSDTLLLTLA